LQKAAAARREREQIRQLFSGGATLAEIFAAAAEPDHPIGKMRISAVLEALLDSKSLVAQILERLKIPDSRRVRGLGDQQRVALEHEYIKAAMTLLRQDAKVKRQVVTLRLADNRDSYRFFDGVDAPGVFLLRVPETAQYDVERALGDAGAAPLPERARAFGAFGITGPAYAVIAVAASPGVWLCVRAAIQTIGERHRHKTFRFDLPDGTSFTVDGYSTTSLTTILAAAGEVYERHLKEARKLRERRQTLANQAARKLLDHHDDLAVDEVTERCLDQVAGVLGDRRANHPDALLRCLRLAVEAFQEREQQTDRLPVTAEDARSALAEVTELLAQADELPSRPET